MANPNFRPALRLPLGFARGNDLIARMLDFCEKPVRLLQCLIDQLFLAAPQNSQEALLRGGMPKPLQSISDLRVREADADVPGSDALDRMSFVEDDEVILQQDAALGFLFLTAKEREKERVIEHQHTRRQHVAARALIEARPPALLDEVRGVPALPGAAQAALRTDLLPDIGGRLDL